MLPESSDWDEFLTVKSASDGVRFFWCSCTVTLLYMTVHFIISLYLLGYIPADARFYVKAKTSLLDAAKCGLPPNLLDRDFVWAWSRRVVADSEKGVITGWSTHRNDKNMTVFPHTLFPWSKWKPLSTTQSNDTAMEGHDRRRLATTW